MTNHDGPQEPDHEPMPLNSDELGEFGQQEFGKLCAAGHLVSNPSTRDRTGWDFIVESQFPSTGSTSAPLETRPKPLSCHVQIKTLWDHNDSIKLRLTSVEHLAKEVKPAFIYVLKVSRGLKVTKAYLIHLLDDPLGRVLKRLRQEDLDGATKANEEYLYWTPSLLGTEIEASGPALRAALEHACGDNPAAYSEKKAEQLKSLGFEGPAFKMTVSFQADSFEDIVNGFLGEGKLKAKNVTTTEIRFGLEKPLKDISDQEALILIEPKPIDGCTITVRETPLSIPAVFRANAFVPGIPNLTEEYQRISLKSDLFTMLLVRQSWTITFKGDEEPQKPSRWIDYWRFCHAMKLGVGTIQIKADKAAIDTTLNISQKAEGGFEADICAWWESVCEGLVEILKHAGVTDEPPMSMRDISDVQRRILTLDRLLNPDQGKTPINFRTHSSGAKASDGEADMLFVDWIPIGDVIVGYCSKSHLHFQVQGDEIEWASENADFVAMTTFSDPKPDLAKFVEHVKNLTKIDNSFIRTFEIAEDNPTAGIADQAASAESDIGS